MAFVRCQSSVDRCCAATSDILQLTTDNPQLTKTKTPRAIASGACKSGLVLAFAVLETFASARLAVLLALAHARIARQQAVGLERRTQFGVGGEQRPRDEIGRASCRERV